MKNTQKIFFLAKDTENNTLQLGFIYYPFAKKSEVKMLQSKFKKLLKDTQNALIVWVETAKSVICKEKRNLQLSIF